MEGTAWPDDSTGMAREISTVPDPPPMRVKPMAIVSPRGAPDSLGWRVPRTTIEWEGGLLFLKERIRTVIEFGDRRNLASARRARSGGLPPSGPPR